MTAPIGIEAIAYALGSDTRRSRAVGRAVPYPYEDSFTLGLRATRPITVGDESALYFASETPLYSANPTATQLAHWLGLGPRTHAHDIEFACKAGTSGLISAVGGLRAGQSQRSLVVAADTATGQVGDALASLTGAGAVGVRLGTVAPIATVEHLTTYNVHSHDFWRGALQAHPAHAGRFSAAQYTSTVMGCVEQFFTETGTTAADFDHVVFHQPNPKLPQRTGKSLGFTSQQMAAGTVWPTTGNLYTATCLLGLHQALAQAEEGQDILLVSYGSGAGSDALWWRTTAALGECNLSRLVPA